MARLANKILLTQSYGAVHSHEKNQTYLNMIKKIKIFFTLFLVLVLLLGVALAILLFKGGPNVRIFEKLGINFKVPIKIRTFLKETILYLPAFTK